MTVSSIQNITDKQLCCGCGICASIAKEEITMVNDMDQGKRPLVQSTNSSENLKQAFQACPGWQIEAAPTPEKNEHQELFKTWGPVLGMWEGYASDPDIRFAGSSGGAASALSLFCLEKQNMKGVVHTAARKDQPIFNETILSKDKDSLIERAGSRYAPASPCDRLDLIEEADGPCVFIGKPCDVAAMQLAKKIKPKLKENLGLTIGFFCAGTPSSNGTIELVKKLGAPSPEAVTSVSYRGKGWPGPTRVEWMENGEKKENTTTYPISWGEILQPHRPWRCFICPDHTGELADVAVGDPWYRPIQEGDSGRSLIIARTEKGKKTIEEAIQAGYLVAETVKNDVLPKSQIHLQKARGKIWGRLTMAKLMGLSVPAFKNFAQFHEWKALSLVEKIRSFTGTINWSRRKKLFSKKTVTPQSKV